ncbi:hypothetical protein FRB90_004332 [Tulasnella sp. 427]|nr:hypothetical protein FRB90_004332 [Tulasnella sp. 427]
MNSTSSSPSAYNYSRGKAPTTPSRLNRHARPYTPTSHHRAKVLRSSVKGADAHLNGSADTLTCGPSMGAGRSLAVPVIIMGKGSPSAVQQPQHFVEPVPGGRLGTMRELAMYQDFIGKHPGEENALKCLLTAPTYNHVQDPRTGRWSSFPTEQSLLPGINAGLLCDAYLRGQDQAAQMWAQRLRHYILDPTEMVQNDYMVPSYMKSEVGHVGELGRYAAPPVWEAEWKETKLAKHPSDNVKRALAIDCEMVLAGEEQILAQVCVVDWWQQCVVYFQYVSPPPGKVITNYVTDKSGITPSILQGANKTLSEVQEDLLYLIQDSNTILIGHGLQSDLRVLKIAHSAVVDTSLIFDPPHGRKKGLPAKVWQRPKLRDLVQVHLQNPFFQVAQHSPIEDAMVCVNLTKAKLTHGMPFGGFGWRTFKSNLDSRRLTRSGGSPKKPSSAQTPTIPTNWQPPSRLPSESFFSLPKTGAVSIKTPEKVNVAMDVDHAPAKDSGSGSDTEVEDEESPPTSDNMSYHPCPVRPSASFLSMVSPTALTFRI